MSDCDSNTQLAQDRIAQALRDSGYAKGYTPQQYAARQWLKACEELAEAGECIAPSTDAGEETRNAWELMASLMQNAANAARFLFDDRCAPEIRDAGKFVKELADVVTPAFVAAQELEVDLACIAVEQAEANVKRGVR